MMLGIRWLRLVNLNSHRWRLAWDGAYDRDCNPWEISRRSYARRVTNETLLYPYSFSPRGKFMQWACFTRGSSVQSSPQWPIISLVASSPSMDARPSARGREGREGRGWRKHSLYPVPFIMYVNDRTITGVGAGRWHQRRTGPGR